MSLWVLVLYVLSALCSSTGVLQLCCNSACSLGHLLRYTSKSDLFSWNGVCKLSTWLWVWRCELERIQEQVGQPLLLSIWLVAQYCVTWWAAGRTDWSQCSNKDSMHSTQSVTGCVSRKHACSSLNWLLAASRILLEEPVIPQPVKKFPALYGTWRFSTVLTTALHLAVS